MCLDTQGEHVEWSYRWQYGGPANGLPPVENDHFVQGVFVAANGPVVGASGAYVDIYPYFVADPANNGSTSMSYTAVFPFKYCVGPEDASPCPATNTTSVPVGKTGYVLNTVTLTAPPGGTGTGYTATTQRSTVCLNGTCQSLPVDGQQAGAGANPNAITPTTGTQTVFSYPVCTGPNQCTPITVPIPTAKVTYNGAPLVAAQVQNTPVTVKPPLSSCYSLGQPPC